MLFTCCELVEVRSGRGQTGKTEDEIELSKLIVAFDFFGVGYKLLIDL